MEHTEIIATNLRALRGALQLTQREVSTRADIDQSKYSALECGKTSPSLGTLFAVCRALECTPNDVLLLPSAKIKRVKR